MAIVSTVATERALRAEFFAKYEPTPKRYEKLATRIESDKAEEVYGWLGSVPMMREWGTGRIAKGLHSERYTVANNEYEATIEIDRKELEDDQIQAIRTRIGELAVAAAVHPDKLLAALFTNGETAGFNSYDGVSFFNTKHETGGSGEQSNKLDFDISVKLPNESDSPNAPSERTCQVAFNEAMAALVTFKNDQGEPMALTDTGLVVVVHPAVKMTWLTALSAGFVLQTANVYPQLGVEVVTMPWFTDLSKWYLCKVDEGTRPFIFQDRVPIEMETLLEGSEEFFKSGKGYVGVRSRYRMAYGYWQYCVRTDFA